MHAIGSSYLIRQAAGAERFGGVTIKIRPRTSMLGEFNVLATDWRSEETINDDVTFLTDAAIEGIKRFANDNAVNLDEWDITVSRFAYHPIDSSARTTQIAAYNAIASALASWHSMRVRLSQTWQDNPLYTKPQAARVLKSKSFAADQWTGEFGHKKMKAAPDRNSTHLAGEYFVAAELYRMGYSVGMTIGNAKAIDILVEKDGRMIPVQVTRLFRTLG